MSRKCRFVAFDLETTGLDPTRDQILQMGAVAFNTDSDDDWHEFEVLVKPERITGTAFALAMNADLLKRIAAHDTPAVSIETALLRLDAFIGEHCVEKPHPVGFNVAAFDCMFVGPFRSAWFHHRPVELGSMLARPDGTPSSSSELVPRFCEHPVAHDALQDARDAARILKQFVFDRRAS